jgi:hypothetical protein
MFDHASYKELHLEPKLAAFCGWLNLRISSYFLPFNLFTLKKIKKLAFLRLGSVGIKLNFEGRKSNKKVMALAFSVRCVARFVERMTGLT